MSCSRSPDNCYTDSASRGVRLAASVATTHKDQTTLSLRENTIGSSQRWRICARWA
jgi:hypothetical protein